jgi:hypothetical protein
MKWDSSAKQTESGVIPFHYTQLSNLKTGIIPEPFPQLDLSKKVKMISVSKEFDTDIITLFHATGDFNYRSKWQEGVKEVEEINHFLPRVGMRCRCLMENGKVSIYASSYHYSPEKIEFSETEENKKNTSYFLLEKISTGKTRLTLDFYIERDLAMQSIFKLIKKRKTEDTFQRSFLNLEVFVKELELQN